MLRVSSFSQSFVAFTVKRMYKGAIGMGVVAGVSILSQAVGLMRAFPDLSARLAIVATFKKSTGLQVLYGSTDKLDGSIGSFVTWRIMGVIIIIMSIWAIVVATRLLRGEEESGRQEVVIANQTTLSKTTALTLKVIGTFIFIQFFLTALITYASNSSKGVSFTVGDAVLISATVSIATLMFAGIASLCSQLYQTRRRASLVASTVLAVAFVVRAEVSINHSASWLRYVSPLSWFDSVQPLTEKNYVWLLPGLLLTTLCISTALLLAKKRDMGEGIITQNDNVKRRSPLLKNSFTSSLLFMRSSIFVWFIIVVAVSGFMSSLSKTVSDALGDSAKFQSTISTITGASSTAAIKIFLGMVFFIVLVLTLIAASQFAGSIRAEEASAQLDTILVRSTSRLSWIVQRLIIAISAVVLLSVSVGVASWVSLPKDAGISASTMVLAGINMIFPALLIIGLGVFLFGVRPRLMTTVMYGVVGWSFLVEIIVPLIWPTSKLLDLSLFHHIALAPATDIDWTKSAIMAGIGSVLGVLGVVAFVRRDIEGE